VSTKPKILVTGGTGFLGNHVVPLLRENFDVHVLSRSGNTEVKGDLSSWGAGVDISELKKKKFDVFLHMAGLYNLKATPIQCFQHNVLATNIALKLAQDLDVKVFINTSTVAAAINAVKEPVGPYAQNFNAPFPDNYAETKALAEKTVREWPANFRRINLRLGVLVGDTKNGEILRADGPYQAPKALEKIRKFISALPAALPLPGNDKKNLPIVPVDIMAQAIVKFCEWGLEPNTQVYSSFHLVPEIGLSAKRLYEDALKYRAIKNKGFYLVNKLPKVLLTKLSEMMTRLPEEELFYLMSFPKYYKANTEVILGKNWCPEYVEYEKSFWSGYEKYISNS
jgi:UDP-glucose 4-epimerase